MKKYKVIFCENYHQYLNYCRENDINPYDRSNSYMYALDISRIVGLRDFEVIDYGTPEKRSDYYEMRHEFRIRNFVNENN